MSSLGGGHDWTAFISPNGSLVTFLSHSPPHPIVTPIQGATLGSVTHWPRIYVRIDDLITYLLSKAKYK